MQKTGIMHFKNRAQSYPQMTQMTQINILETGDHR